MNSCAPIWKTDISFPDLFSTDMSFPSIYASQLGKLEGKDPTAFLLDTSEKSKEDADRMRLFDWN